MLLMLFIAVVEDYITILVVSELIVTVFHLFSFKKYFGDFDQIF